MGNVHQVHRYDPDPDYPGEFGSYNFQTGEYHPGFIVSSHSSAVDAVNHLGSIADNAMDAGATVTGGGFALWTTSPEGVAHLYKVWRV